MGRVVHANGNAAIGVAWQIFIVVVVFIASVFGGIGLLIARFVGAGDEGKVDRVVFQAFLVAIGMSLFSLAPVGYFAAPALLDFVTLHPQSKNRRRRSCVSPSG